ncbi:MAG TPA: NTP transferase domain-containing protein [Polyangiaceae bacterium]|nr:NTP transferase domain-containing protein [Polyangiaceae bacterium]
MKAIIIGAGRGSRLRHETNDVPKTLVPVLGRTMLDFILEALEGGGIPRSDVVFVCGYAEDVVRERHPELTFVRNADWENNNILLSLLTAREHLVDGFVSTYADIVYEADIVKKLVASPHALTLGCDTRWRRRYVDRSQHPETDAEKLRAEGSRVVEISRKIASDAASGEFIGVMRATKTGAASFLRAFDEAKAKYAGRTFREGRTFERAYLIDLLEEMVEAGAEMHRVDTPGGYMELDTLEDLAAAERWWSTR